MSPFKSEICMDTEEEERGYLLLTAELPESLQSDEDRERVAAYLGHLILDRWFGTGLAEKLGYQGAHAGIAFHEDVLEGEWGVFVLADGKLTRPWDSSDAELAMAHRILSDAIVSRWMTEKGLQGGK